LARLESLERLQPELNKRLLSFCGNVTWTSASSIRGTFWQSMHNTFLVFPIRDEIVSIYFW
jgi:hypothetical protein